MVFGFLLSPHVFTLNAGDLCVGNEPKKRKDTNTLIPKRTLRQHEVAFLEDETEVWRS